MPLPANLLTTAPAPIQVRDAGGATIANPQSVQDTATVVPIVVTGSKGANAALTSLMAALVSLGLVVDTTS